MNPTTTPNHNVNNRIIMAKASAIEISIPNNVESPPKLPSVTPIPAGNIETAPNMTDVEYNEIISKYPIMLIPNPIKTK